MKNKIIAKKTAECLVAPLSALRKGTDMKVVQEQRNSRMCAICGSDNPACARASFYNMEDGSVRTVFLAVKSVRAIRAEYTAA